MTSRTNATDNPSHALQGASLAFSSTSTNVEHLPNTYSGTNGALAAASSAGYRTTRTSPATNKQLQGRGLSELRRSHGKIIEGRSEIDPQADKQRQPRQVFSTPLESHSSSNATSPAAASRTQSPSHVAAVLAASRSSCQRDQDLLNLSSSGPPKSIPVRQSRSPASHTTEVSHLEPPADDTPIAGTNALVKLYESIEDQYTRMPKASQRNGRSPMINPNPASIRPLSTARTETLVSPLEPNVRKRNIEAYPVEYSSIGAAAAAARLAKPAVSRNSWMIRNESSAPNPTPPRRAANRLAISDVQLASSSFSTHSTSSSSSYTSAVDQFGSPTKGISEFRLHDGSSDVNNAVVSSDSQQGLNIQKPTKSHIKEQSPSRPIFNKSSRSFDGPVSAPTRGQLRSTLSTASSIPQLTADSLANAMVASSLASSRAPSPTKPQAPPPRRHGRPHSLFHRSHSTEEISRTPSPAKQMRQTLRTSRKSEDEEQAYKAKRSHFMKKHPNKHHEGDRKRWRDTVSEAERKRYEGVWAANKDLLHPPGPAGAPLNTVLDIVVQDIWRRSRLPDDVLGEIWNLVNTTGQGALGKEEFVVGMWLIDQRLKGRKLPVRVSESVWGSVRMLSGIKIPKHRR